MIGRANPYVGPRAFRTGERLYGRDRELKDLVDLLAAERIVLLYSPSGAGKTSLICAGLIPAMLEEGYQVLPRVRPGLDIESAAEGPGGNPYVDGILATWESKGLPPGEPPLPSVAGMPLSGYLSQRSWIQSGGALKLIILDQFEEVLTSDPGDVETKRQFFQELGEALRDPMVFALIAMREEYSAALDAYRQLLPTRLANRYRLDLLHRDEAGEAIAAPAKAAGVSIAPETVRRLLDDLGTVRERTSSGAEVVRKVPFIEPLYLQIVCHRLWHKLPEGITEVTPAALDATGVNQVADALEHYFASVVEAVAEETGKGERAIREWLENELVTHQGLRRQVLRGERETAGMDNAVARGLAGRSLLRADSRAGTDWYEITHDRLAAVVRDDNARWYTEHLQPFQVRAAQFGRLRRSGAGASMEILVGRDLAHALRWAEAHPEALTGLDRELLSESSEVWRRRRRESLLKAAVAATVVVGAIAFGLFQRDAADRQRELNRRIQVQGALEHSRSLLAEAANQRWVHNDTELAALLALQSQRAAKDFGVVDALGPWAEQQLRLMLQSRPFSFSLPSGEQGLLSGRLIALTRSGRWMAIQSALDRVTVRIPEVLGGTERVILAAGRIVALSFTDDDSALDIITERGLERHALDAVGETPILRIETTGQPSGVYCSTLGGRIFLVTEDGTIEVWETGEGASQALEPLSALSLESAAGATLTTLLCQRDGDWLAWGNDLGEWGLVDLEGGRRDTVRIFRNRIDDWPDDLKNEWYFRRRYLELGVSSMHYVDGQYMIFALHEQGPPRIIDLRAGLAQAQSAYLLPNDDSAARLGVARAAGRAARYASSPEHLMLSAISRDGLRIAVGGERSSIGWWDLEGLSLDPGESDPPLVPIESACSLDPAAADPVGEAVESRCLLYADYQELPPLGGAVRALRFTLPRTKGAPQAQTGEGDDTWLAAADWNGNLRWWSIPGFDGTGHLAHRPEVAGVVYGLGFLDAGGTRLAFGGSQGSGVLAIDPEGGNTRPEQGIRLPHYTRSLAVSSDFSRMVVATGDVKPVTGLGRVKDSDWPRGRHAWLLEPLTKVAEGVRSPVPLAKLHRDGQWAAATALEGRLLLVAGWDGVIALYAHEGTPEGPWKAAAIGPLLRPDGEKPTRIRGAALRPDGRQIALGTQDGRLLILRGSRLDFRAPETLLASGIRMDAVAYSPKGDRLAVGDYNGVLWTWLVNGDRLAYEGAVQAHRDAVLSVAYGEDGRLVSGGADGGVYLWDAGTPDPTRRLRLQGTSSEVQSVAISKGGGRLAAGTTSGRIHLWELDLDRVMARACAAMFRNLGWQEWRRYVGKDRYQCTCPNLPPAADVPAQRIDAETCPAGAP